MHEIILSSGRDALLIGIPFLIMLLICFLRLDEIFASSKQVGGRKYRRAVCGTDEDGRQILCDPDGRPWVEPRSRR